MKRGRICAVLAMVLLLTGCGEVSPSPTMRATAMPEATVPATPDPKVLEEAANEQAYRRALTLLEDGAFLPAYEAFAALGDYEDSAVMAEQCYILEEQAVYEAYALHETAESMRRYLAQHPDGLFAAEAQAQLAKLELYEDTLEMLIFRDMLVVEITGYSISQVVLRLQNTSAYPLALTIPYGTVCRAKAAGLQDMLLLEEAAFALAAGETLVYEAKTVCLDIDKDIPGATDSFTLEHITGEHPYITLLPLLEGRSFAVAQSAVWLHSDKGAAESDIIEALVYSNDEAVIVGADVEAARALLEEAGLG